MPFHPQSLPIFQLIQLLTSFNIHILNCFIQPQNKDQHKNNHECSNRERRKENTSLQKHNLDLLQMAPVRQSEKNNMEFFSFLLCRRIDSQGKWLAVWELEKG